MRAEPRRQRLRGVACDTNDGWISGNILFDRDIYGAGAHGDFGVSLTGGRVAFGVSAGSAGNTICGATDVADGAWHHVAVTRQSRTAGFGSTSTASSTPREPATSARTRT